MAAQGSPGIVEDAIWFVLQAALLLALVCLLVHLVLRRRRRHREASRRYGQLLDRGLATPHLLRVLEAGEYDRFDGEADELEAEGQATAQPAPPFPPPPIPRE